MKEEIENLIKNALEKLGAGKVNFSVEHPEDLTRGDYATNAAMVVAKILKKNPAELAQKLVAELKNFSSPPAKGEVGGGLINKIEAVPPGFVNFFLAPEFFGEEIKNILEQKKNYGRGTALIGQKTVIEYTDPNPFKEFHVGHLMANTIGETIARLFEWNGTEVKRACYQGDIGLHVAMAVWAILKNNIESDRIAVEVLGRMYVAGSAAYKSDEQAKKEIEDINKKIYNLTDPKINKIYNQGRKISLDYFETIYKRLGTKFDFYFFESTAGNFGSEIVREFSIEGNLPAGRQVFEQSDGAIIFRGEKYGLHTRVFVNSQGLPTYEAKELGLAKIKYDLWPYDFSITVTGNEQSDYFKVVLKAMSLVFPELAAKTKHISHGMLRLPGGKMSSHTGEVVTAESLLAEIGGRVKEKISASGGKKSEKITQATDGLIDQIAVAALKYSILKQAIGRDIIFDFDKSLSFEGDSGPYLQYSHARACSVLEKAASEKISAKPGLLSPAAMLVARLLSRFPDIVERAWRETAPQLIASYLIELCRAFNSFYAIERIADKTDASAPAKVALTSAFAQVLKNGLTVLGIQAPEKM